nr:class I SAM-dependent methyltransferase [Ancylobacter radicis]
MNVLVEHSWIEARRRVQRFAQHGIALRRDDRPLRVLDIGGGYGFFGAELMRAVPGIDVTVVEPSSSRVEMGKGYLKDAGDGTPVPEFLVEIVDEDFAARHAGAFDIVTLWHVLEHLTDPVDLLRNTARLIREDGVICVEVPNVDDDLQALSPSFRERSFMAEHISYFSRHTLENVARRAGDFRHVGVHGYQRYGIFNYFHWIHFNKPQGANPDLFEGTDRWWLETTWRAAREAAVTSDALFMIMKR